MSTLHTPGRRPCEVELKPQEAAALRRRAERLRLSAEARLAVACVINASDANPADLAEARIVAWTDALAEARDDAAAATFLNSTSARKYPLQPPRPAVAAGNAHFVALGGRG